jgi:hypothetical protein
MSPQFHRRDELPFKKLSTREPQPPARRLRIKSGCRLRHPINRRLTVFRKSILAIAAVASLGAAALAPTSASAHWYGYGYGNYYHYKPYHYGFYGPRFFYGPRYFYGGWKFGGWRRGYGYY